METKEFDELSNEAKTALSFLWNTPNGITVKQAREVIRKDFGVEVENELKILLGVNENQETDK